MTKLNNVKVPGILTSPIADKTISIAAKMLLSLDSRRDAAYS